MSMGKMNKINDIERLLQAVETPEKFDEIELAEVMNSEDTKELYSLLSDIESVKTIDNAPHPDVNAEWSNFSRWMRRHRTLRPSHSLRKFNSWHAYISMAAVVLFALFIAVPFMIMDETGDDADTAKTEGRVITDLKGGDDLSGKVIGTYDNDMFLDYRIAPVHSYTLPKSCFDLEIDVTDNNIIGLSSGSLEYLFSNFTIFKDLNPYIIDIGRLAPKGCSRIDIFPTHFVKW